MEALFAQVDYWHWWILGVLLVVLEVFAPGTFFLWLAIAAGINGVVLWLFPAFGWEYQILLFSLLSVGSILGWRAYAARHPRPSPQPALNRRGQQYLGRTFTLDGPIVNGYGKLRVDDTLWRISGEDCPAGSRITVTAVDGTVLKVEQMRDNG